VRHQHGGCPRGGQSPSDVFAFVAKRVKLPGEFYRVVERKLCARADGEMGSMSGVAHQNDMRPAIELAPGAPVPAPGQVEAPQR
jgi:hypothetical protein